MIRLVLIKYTQRIASIYLFSLLFMYQGVSLAADLVLTVKERGTGNTVEGATVVIGESNVYQTTGVNGEASFSDADLSETVSPVKIKVLASGFEEYIKIFNRIKNHMTLYIYPLTVEGEGLVVTADRIIEKSSKITLSTEELLTAAGSMGDPLKAIAALPGIVPVGDGSAEVYMRGSNANENIVWINRAPVSYLYHLGGFLSVINPSLIQDINVFLGGFPVEYGDALGGAIDVTLRPPKNDRIHTRFDISTIAASFLVEGPVSDDSEDSFYIAVRRSYLDALFSPDEFNDAFEDDDEDDPDQFTLVPRFYDSQALFRHVVKNGSIDTFLFTAGDQLEIDIRGSAVSDPQLAGLSNQKSQFVTGGSTWQQAWNNMWDSSTTLSYTNEKFTLSLGQDDTGNPFFADIESYEVFFQPEVHWRRKKDEIVTFGLQSSNVRAPLDIYLSRLPREDDVNFDFTSQQKFIVQQNLYITSYAPYVKYRKQWGQKWATTLGLRFSSMSISGGYRAQEFSPRASLEYNASSNTLLTATWGRYIQAPGALDLMEGFGNPKLEITESEHRVLGIQHRFNSLYSLKTEVYHKPMKNLVVAIDGNAPPDNFANEGSGEAVGIDIFLKREPRAGVTGWLALSWAKSRRTNELTSVTRDFDGDQPITLTAVWGQPFGGKMRRWSWSMKAEIHSGTPYTEVTGRHLEDPGDPDSRFIPEFGKHNAARLPTYYKVDVRFAKEILYKESIMEIYLDLQNITFRRNVTEYNYGNEYEFIDNPKEITGLGFFPFIGVKYEY